MLTPVPTTKVAMKNSPHHLKHLVKKSIRTGSRLNTSSPTVTHTTQKLQVFNENLGELSHQAASKVKKVFQSYLKHLEDKHFGLHAHKRTTPGHLNPNKPHSHIQQNDQKKRTKAQAKLGQASEKLTKKMLKKSKVRWKKIKE